MRSEAVFRAHTKLEGRFQLCMLCAKGLRRLHNDSVRIQDTINDVLTIIGAERQAVLNSPQHILFPKRPEA